MSDTRPPPPSEETPTSRGGPPMPEKPISTTKVRQGVTLGHMRWVLLISLILAVVAFIVAYSLVI
jgi:hypothetical protein